MAHAGPTRKTNKRTGRLLCVIRPIGELNEMLAKNLPTEKELMAAAKKVGEAASKSRDLKMRSVIEMRSLLTPEQLEKFMEFRRKAAARR